MDYSLCKETVTIYRREPDRVIRTVVHNCYLEMREKRDFSTIGCHRDTCFLLIMPGSTQQVFPGDRVMRGIGPEVALEQWREFIPAAVPGLGEASYAAPFYWNGEISHVEAGHRWKTS